MQLDPSLINENWRVLENALDRFRQLDLRFRSTYRTPRPNFDASSEAVYLRRNYHEMERVINEYLKVCCLTCQFKIPFPNPYDETGAVVEYQIERNLYEIEEAIRSIQTCAFPARGFEAHLFRSALGLGGQISSVSFGSWNNQAVSLATAEFGGVSFPTSSHTGFGPDIGNWGGGKQSFCCYFEDTGILRLMIINTSSEDMDEWTADQNVYDFSLWENVGQLRFIPPGNRYVMVLGTEPGGTEDSLYVIDVLTSQVIGQIARSQFNSEVAGGIDYFVFSPDGRYFAVNLAVDEFYENLFIFDRNAGTLAYSSAIDRASSGRRRYQFTDPGDLLYYVGANGILYVRQTSDWSLVTAQPPIGGFRDAGHGEQRAVYWGQPRLSPDRLSWSNTFNFTSGGAFDLEYRSYQQFFDDGFNLVIEHNVSAFASGLFEGDFDETSDWWFGGDANINGSALIRYRDGGWTDDSQGGSGVYDYQMRPFQAF